MTPKESAIYWRGLAKKYHSFGLNIVPLGSDKKPVITGISKSGAPFHFQWEAWTDTEQENGKLFEGILSPNWWADVRGIAALAGPVSGWLVVLDGDHADIAIARQHLHLLGLPDDYEWFNPSGSGDGWHCYIFCPEWLQDKSNVKFHAIGGGVVEVRWKGTYTALPGSHHPSGNLYPGDPAKAPHVVRGAALQAFRDAITNGEVKPKQKDEPKGKDKAGGGTAYGLAALTKAVDRVRTAPERNRNNTLNREAKPLGELVGGGELDRAHVEAELTAAALACGLGDGEIRETLRSALDAGEKEPRTAPESERTSASTYTGDPDVTAEDAQAFTEGDDARPTIEVDQQLSVLVRLALRAAIRANDADPQHPVLYVRAGTLARVLTDERGQAAIVPVDPGALLAVLADVANWVTVTPKGEYVDQKVPMSVVTAFLNQSEWPGLPVLEGVSMAPVFGRDGSLHDSHGYDQRTQIYNASTLTLGSTEPTPQALQAALSVFFDDMLHDFPFVDAASKAHALALILLPFCRHMIDGATPLHLISAPAHGAGKSLLAECALLPAYGREPAATPEARSGDEWSKLLTTVLMDGRPIVFLDNVARPLEGSGMATALTQAYWSDRLLGLNRTVNAPIRCVWVASAKNPVTSPEIARRCCLIRIDPNSEHPEDRTGFKHPHIKRWILSNRVRLVTAAVTIVRNWVQRGMPLWKGSIKGSYESWTEVIGGILDTASVAGFLGNEKAMRESAPETLAMGKFVEQWFTKFEEKPTTAKDLFPLASLPEDEKADDASHYLGLLAPQLGTGNRKSQQTKLGVLLAKNVDAVFGGRKIVRCDAESRDGGKTYQLKQIDHQNAERSAKVPRPFPEVEGGVAEPAEPHSSHAYAGKNEFSGNGNFQNIAWLDRGSAGSANGASTRGSGRGTFAERSALPPYLGRVLTVSELQDAVSVANAEKVRINQLPTAGGWKIELA